MEHEYQVIEHNYYRGLNLFLSKLYYRAPHYHKECELMLALEGEADIIYSNGRVSHFSEGQVAVIGPMEIHEIRSSENGITMITIQTSFAMMEYFLSKQISPFYFADTDLSRIMTPEEQEFLSGLCLDLAFSYHGMPEDDAGECFTLQARLINFLVKLLPKADRKNDEGLRTGAGNQTISRILEYADENYHSKLTLGEIAEKENLSLSYLSHAFKDALGISFQEYLKHKRFENASRLLQSSEMTLLDISIASGFSDVRYMMKAFSEIAGCTPAEYRRNYREYSEENSRAAETSQYYLTRDEACRKLNEYREKTRKIPGRR